MLPESNKYSYISIYEEHLCCNAVWVFFYVIGNCDSVVLICAERLKNMSENKTRTSRISPDKNINKDYLYPTFDNNEILKEKVKNNPNLR